MATCAGAGKSIFSEDGSATWAIVETIPEGVDLYSEYHTYETWLELIQNAKSSIRIGAFYMDFANGTNYLDWEGGKGVAVLDALIAAGRRGVKIELALNEQVGAVPYSPDPHILMNMGLAEVHWVKWSLVAKSGILHTKLIMTDDENIYLGSANIAWDSMTQVKELGLVFTKSPLIVGDARKVWDMYWYLGAKNTTSLPDPWPAAYNTFFNGDTPLNADIQGDVMDLFISVDPLQLATPGRELDLTAITTAINDAERFVYFSIMDYGPFTAYEQNNFYFPALDTAFRAAPFNTKGLEVRLLFGVWNHTLCDAYPYLQSLAMLKNVSVRVFKIPDLPMPVQIPFTRVAHNKYLVTDSHGWVSTQNSFADYFLTTGGMSFNVKSDAVVGGLVDKFFRDWDSKYAEDICIGVDCSYQFEPCSSRPINS